MADAATLTGLTPREAIADALHRCVLGIDSNKQDLFASECLKNDTMKVLAGPMAIGGWAAINDFFQRLFTLVTTHTVSNIRVQVEEGADKASMTSHAIPYHVRPDEAFKVEDTSYTAPSLYDMDLVRDGGDGMWRIKKWDIKILWTMGDVAVLHGQS